MAKGNNHLEVPGGDSGANHSVFGLSRNHSGAIRLNSIAQHTKKNEIKTLMITCLKGQLYRNTEMFGKMDPFLEFEYRGKTFQSKVHEDGGKTPVWNEKVSIPLTGGNPEHDSIIIRCFD